MSRCGGDTTTIGRLKAGFWNFNRGLPGGRAGEFDLAFVDAVAGGDVEGVFVEVAVVDAAVFIAGFWEDELDAAGLVEDLEACFGSDEEVAIGGGELAVEGAAAIGGGALGVEVGLFVH